MKRLAIVIFIGVLFFFSSSTSLVGDIGLMLDEQSNPVQSQDPVGINFVSPSGGDNLSGNVTIKVNMTVIVGTTVRLQWNDDSWVDLADYYNSTSHFYEYPMDVSCLPAGNVRFVAQQVTTHGTAQATLDANIDWERPPILIVDDYYDENVTQYYTSALEALGYANGSGYNVWRVASKGSPNSTHLLDYQFVIWYRSADASTILGIERSAMETFLSNPSPRKLLLTGTEIAWRAFNVGYEAWLSYNFGVYDWIGDGSNTENVIGSVGGMFEGVNYSYGGGDGSKVTGGPDWIRTLGYSQGIFGYQTSGDGDYAATLSPMVNGMFFGFAFDAISNQTDRIDAMNRTLNYFGIYNPSEVNLTSPLTDDLVSSPVTMTWDSNSGLHPVIYSPIYHLFVDGQRVVSSWIMDTCQVPISEGIHTIRLVCQDNYGQRAYDTVTIEVDSTSPRMELLTHQEGSVLNSGTLLGFNLTDIHLQDAVARWDSDSWTPFSSPYQSFLPSGDGTHILDINATDEAGNWNNTQFNFICDDTMADISIVNVFNGSVLKSGSLIDVEVNDTHLDIVMYHWDLYDDEEVPYIFELSLPSGDGPHDLYVNATDAAGNQQLGHFQFITDDQVPTISLMGITNGTVLETGTPIYLGVNDTHYEIARFQWDLDEDTYFEDEELVVYSPPVEGEHWLYVNATDEAGNIGIAKFMFIVDNTAPDVSVVSPVEGSHVLSGTQITIDVFDLHLDTVHFRWDTEEWSVWSGPYLTHAPIGDGYHALFVNATDATGNWVQVVFVFITDDTATSTTTETTTTTQQTTSSTAPTTTTTTSTQPVGSGVDPLTSIGLMGLGIGIGIAIAVIILQLLQRRKSPST